MLWDEGKKKKKIDTDMEQDLRWELIALKTWRAEC